MQWQPEHKESKEARVPKCAIYARVSTSEGKQTTENQTIPLIEYCNRMGWSYVLYEEQMSATKHRPIFNNLMFDAKQRKFDILLAWSLDRLSRSVVQFSQIAVELNKLKIRLIVLNNNIDTDISSPFTSLLMNVLISFAQFEREMIVERVKAGIHRRKKSGKPIGGGNRKILVDIEKIREYKLEGWSIREIAKKLGVSHGKIGKIVKQAGLKSRQVRMLEQELEIPHVSNGKEIDFDL